MFWLNLLVLVSCKICLRSQHGLVHHSQVVVFLHLLKQVSFPSWFMCGNTQFNLLLQEIPLYLSYVLYISLILHRPECCEDHENIWTSKYLFRLISKSDHVFKGTDKLLLYLVMRETSASDSSKAILCRKGKQEGLLPCAAVVVPAEARLQRFLFLYHQPSPDTSFSTKHVTILWQAKKSPFILFWFAFV